MTFSLHEMKVVLASMLTSVRLHKRHPGPAPVTLRGFTLVPKGGVQVVLDGPIVRTRVVPSVKAVNGTAARA